MRSTLVITFCVFLPVICSGQLNFKVGYRFGIPSSENFNKMLEEYYRDLTDAQSELDYRLDANASLRELSFLHGFDLGLRYHFDKFSVEGGWIQKRKTLSTEGNYGEDGRGASFRNRITVAINSISGGLQSHIGPVSLGATVDYNINTFKGNFEQPISDNNENFDHSDNAWSSHFSITYTIRTQSSLALAIQPYYQVFWQETGFGAAADEIFGEGNYTAAPTRDKFNTFGIAFIIYNGPPRRW